MATAKLIYRIENPDTGAIEYIEKGGKVYTWVTLCEYPSEPGPVRHLGFSNATDQAGAIKSARATYKYGTRHTAVHATIVTADERTAELAAAETAPTAHRFVCTACGATDANARCLGGALVHTAGQHMLPADFDRYTASRRPIDKDAAAQRRAAIKAAREAITALDTEAPQVTVEETAHAAQLAAQVAAASAKAAAANTHLSPTAQATVAAGAARDEAMRLAYEAEGTDGEAAADAAFRSADALYHNATRNHRAACEAWVSPRDTPAPEPEPVEETAPAAVEQAPTYASCPVKWMTGDPCEGCRARAKAITATEAPVHPALAAGYAATAALTPKKAAAALAVGTAYTTTEPEPAERPRMTNYQVNIAQTINTTVYVEAPDAEAAEALAVEELGELCAQCAGMAPRESPAVTEVNRYVNDHYGEPEVIELDEHGCIKDTSEDEAAAVEAFARVVTEESLKRDGGIPVPPLSVLVNPDPANLADLPEPIMSGHHLEPATRERLTVAVEEPEALAHMTEAERKCDLLARKYLYSAERYARSGDGEDGERADNILELFHLAAFAADQCAAIGVDWTCGEATTAGDATCPAHRGALPRKGTGRG